MLCPVGVGKMINTAWYWLYTLSEPYIGPSADRLREHAGKERKQHDYGNYCFYFYCHISNYTPNINFCQSISVMPAYCAISVSVSPSVYDSGVCSFGIIWRSEIAVISQ